MSLMSEEHLKAETGNPTASEAASCHGALSCHGAPLLRAPPSHGAWGGASPSSGGSRAPLPVSQAISHPYLGTWVPVVCCPL